MEEYPSTNVPFGQEDVCRALEILMFTFLCPASYLLRTSSLVVLKCCSTKWSFWQLTAFDYACLIVPTVLACTVLADRIAILLITLLVVSVSIILLFLDSGTLSRSFQLSNGPELTYDTVSMYRAYVLLATSLCIAAVDTVLFPFRFGKTESYGFSLMDIGVGMVIFGSGLVSNAKQFRLGNHLWQFATLCSLGLIRLALIWLLDYQSCDSEYGRHWNFFFTSAVVLPLGNLACKLSPARVQLVLAIAIACGYEIALRQFKLAHFLLANQSKRADGLFSLNREGVTSLLGLLAIYMTGGHVSSCLLKSKQGRRVSTYALHLLLLAASMALLVHCEMRPSRRLVNLAYIVWIVLLSIVNLALVEIVLRLSQVISKLDGCSRANYANCIYWPINRRGLEHFLLSNVLTGCLNLFAAKALKCSFYSALAMAFYSIVTTMAVVKRPSLHSEK